jgi:hypothetical protein
MRVSPGPSTRTCPPVNAAISEFVVPKSIPTISSLIFFPRRRTRNFHLRRSKQFSIPFVAAAVHLDHRAFGNGARFLAIDGVHPPRIERLPLTRNLARIEFLQRLVQPLESQLVPFFQCGERRAGGVVPRPRLIRPREDACAPSSLDGLRDTPLRWPAPSPGRAPAGRADRSGRPALPCGRAARFHAPAGRARVPPSGSPASPASRSIP